MMMMMMMMMMHETSKRCTCKVTFQQWSLVLDHWIMITSYQVKNNMVPKALANMVAGTRLHRIEMEMFYTQVAHKSRKFRLET